MSPSGPSRRTEPDVPVPVPTPSAQPPAPSEAAPPKVHKVPLKERVASKIRYGWIDFRRGARKRAAKIARFRLLRDVIGAIIIVGIVMGTLSATTGGAWPPLLVVESGSMMHLTSETSYGRIGTIDVGDIVFMRAEDASKVELWVDGGKFHYDRPGDVVAFAQNGNHDTRVNITIIHRAITYVEVVRTTTGTEYRMKWIDGEIKTWGNDGIYFPPLGFDERFEFSPRAGYKPLYSGYITKGDNPITNPAADQALGISAIVHPTWIKGTVHGEAPWLGLGKLALQNGRTNPSVPGWSRVGNGFAPIELWSMFFLVVALVVLVPLSIDTHRNWRADRHRARERQILREPPVERKPVEFQSIGRR